jgi:membrane protein involved in D-alanine export
MKPYSDLFGFYILFLSLIPAIVLGAMGKKIKYYGLLVTFFMINIYIGNNKIEWACFILFFLGELILIEGYFYIRKRSKNRWIMRFFVALSILPLVLVKLSPHFTLRTIGFIGISYVTFRVVQIIIETYDGLITSMNILDIIYFLYFFPSLSSGPIDRSRSFEKQIQSKIEGNDYLSQYLLTGIIKIARGAVYKFIIADLLNTYWLSKISSVHTLSNILQYMYAYTLYLFFDFAGYSLMAIGTGYILGIKMPENFNAPFLSRNMKEFWDRWHISLSVWFRDFIYTRCVMGFMKKKIFKSRFTASYVAYIITMGTMGIWHGFKRFYIIYGLYMALVLIATDYFQRKNPYYKKYKNKTWWKVCAIIINFNVVCFGILLFSGYLYNR